MTADLFDSDAVQLSVIADIPMQVGRIDGRWRLRVCDRGWRLLPDSIACFSDIADELEMPRVKDWVAKLIGVGAVELLHDPRRPGTFVVDVSG